MRSGDNCLSHIRKVLRRGKGRGKKHLWYQLILLTNTSFFVAFLIFRLAIHQRRRGQGFGEPSIKHIQLLKRPFLGRVRLEARWEKQPTTGSTRASRGGNLRQNKAWLFASQQVLNCLPRCILFLNVCAGKCPFERFIFISFLFLFFSFVPQADSVCSPGCTTCQHAKKIWKKTLWRGSPLSGLTQGAVGELLGKALSNYHGSARTPDYWRRDEFY